MATDSQMLEIARRLRIETAASPSHVMLVNGGQGGKWIEIQRDRWYFQTSDREGNWSLTAYTSFPNREPNTFSHQFEGMGVTAYWLYTREDGPDGDTASVDEVIEYLRACGVFRADIPPQSAASEILPLRLYDAINADTVQGMVEALRGAGVPFLQSEPMIVPDAGLTMLRLTIPKGKGNEIIAYARTLSDSNLYVFGQES
jgi:hypothetical protein